GGVHHGDPRVGAQQVGQLVQRRRLVVDREHPQVRGRHLRIVGHAALRVGTARWNFGIRMLTFIPAPGAVSTTSPNSSPKTDRSRSSTLLSPTCWSESAASSLEGSVGVNAAPKEPSTDGSMPTPSSSTVS